MYSLRFFVSTSIPLRLLRSPYHMITRCAWPKSDLSIHYHDHEWGTPSHSDAHLFEKLILDGAQAGLSWEIILRKRENYRKALDGFDYEKIARYSAKKIEKLMLDPGIVRNRLKINSAVTNAKATIAVIEECGSLDAYLWQFVEGKPVQNRWRSMKEVPAKTKQSDAMSKDMKKRGFKFVGSTICYAFMQAVGMVNDHTTDCFRHRELGGK